MTLLNQMKAAKAKVQKYKIISGVLLNDPDFSAYCQACESWREAEQELNNLYYKIEGLL